MQRLKGRSIVFGALAVLACSGDPTGNESTPTAIQATPDVVFVTQGDSQAVIVSVIDEQGQILQSDPQATNVGAGIAVTRDPNYQSTTIENPIDRQFRFFVKGIDLTKTTFTLNALGLTRDIEVTTVPGALTATVSDSLPALGDTVTITAPTGTIFTDSSELRFEGGAPQVVSQDATQITFIPFPNIDGPASVSNVGVTSNPNLVFTLATPFRIKTDSITDIGTNVTPTTPALGGTVTLVLPTDLRVIPESLHQSGVAPDTAQRGLNIANNPVQPLNIAVSADSTTITFVPPPNSDSFVVVPGVVHRNLPQYPLELTTTAKVTTPVIDSIPGNLSTTTPAANQAVTLTVTDASFGIDPAATVAIGAGPTVVTNRTANSISFIPAPGATGNVIVSGATIAGFSLELPSKTPSITVGAATTLPGSDDPTTAPIITAPAAGVSTTLYDLPDYAATTDHFYRLNVGSAGDYTITADWTLGSDIDMFVCDSPLAPDLSNCDFTTATGDKPESATFTLTAGTHILVLDDFGAFDGNGDGAPDGTPAVGTQIQITVDH
jgi:hypothetical protein